MPAPAWHLGRTGAVVLLLRAGCGRPPRASDPGGGATRRLQPRLRGLP